VGGGGRPRAAASRGRKGPRAGHCGRQGGALVGDTGWLLRRGRGGEGFQGADRGGKLKIWKTDHLPPDQITRISELQVSTHADTPEILPNGSGWGRGVS
jgi:hypothetical protein